jgi:hypothetical protein
MLKIRFIAILVLGSVLLGCQTRTERPQRIAHIVFIELNNPGDYDEILRDSEAMLSTIPGVSTYHAGAHLDTGRSTILDDYDLAIILGFESEADLAHYVAHEQHIEYVTKWKPKLRVLRVYDVLDE